jgi:hypothetical protein
MKTWSIILTIILLFLLINSVKVLYVRYEFFKAFIGNPDYFWPIEKGYIVRLIVMIVVFPTSIFLNLKKQYKINCLIAGSIIAIYILIPFELF